MTGNYSQTDEKQIMAQELREQLKEARKEIANLKKKAKEDIEKLWEEFVEYNLKRKDFETELDKQIKEREDRASSQFGWGQAVNFVPIFSHAYSFATSKTNELLEKAESDHRDTLIKTINDKYENLEGLYNEIIKSYDQEQN